MLHRFVDDDFGYLQWLRDRPGTFVLDTERRPSRSFVVVHRAECSSISGPTRSGGWTTRQIKVCASTYEEIEDWSQYHVSVNPTRCHLCKPSSNAGGGDSEAADPAPAEAASPETSEPEAPAGGSTKAEAAPATRKRRATTTASAPATAPRAGSAAKAAKAAKAPAQKHAGTTRAR